MSGKPPLVFVVDDDSDFRRELTELLEEHGCHVAGANSARSALHLLKDARCPNVIILDLWMPGMDGWQLRQELQSHPTLSQVPIVVVTAAVPPSAESMEVAAVLRKPIPAASLLATLQRYC